jgi:pimeloyl-ACP methyl ester carboxylesterase
MAAPDYLEVEGAQIAYRQVKGWGRTTLVWLGGFRSDMLGAKAEALAAWASETGHGFVRFDYFGHGESEGAFEAGTIGRWLGDALAVMDALTRGPVILIGSSMGGWLACLAAEARPKRVRGMVLIAPAADFTSELLEPQMSDEARAALAATHIWMRPSDYGEPYPITQHLLEEGRAHAILGGPVRFEGPVRVLQGGQDADVPWRHALRLAEAISSPDVVFTLIKDGDHRLSRPQDLARLILAVEELA